MGTAERLSESPESLESFDIRKMNVGQVFIVQTENSNYTIQVIGFAQGTERNLRIPRVKVIDSNKGNYIGKEGDLPWLRVDAPLFLTEGENSQIIRTSPLRHLEEGESDLESIDLHTLAIGDTVRIHTSRSEYKVEIIGFEDSGAQKMAHGILRKKGEDNVMLRGVFTEIQKNGRFKFYADNSNDGIETGSVKKLELKRAPIEKPEPVLGWRDRLWDLFRAA